MLFNFGIKESFPHKEIFINLIFLFLRPNLEAPYLQQASFDDVVYEVDVMRNVATRRINQEKSHVRNQPSLPVSFSYKLLFRTL